MKSLDRNKRYIYFANRVGQTEIIDEYGNVTGQFSPSYSDVAEVLINESAARGTADVEQFGFNTNYSKTLATNDINCPLSENSVLWVGFGKIEDYDETKTYPIGTYVKTQDSILKCLGEEEYGVSWEKVPYNYIVVGVAKSLNSITYAIREVKVNG